MSSEPTDTISINCGAGDAPDADNHDDNHDAAPAAIPSGDDLVSIRMASGTVVKAPASYWLECFRTHTFHQQEVTRDVLNEVLKLCRQESLKYQYEQKEAASRGLSEASMHNQIGANAIRHFAERIREAFNMP